MKRKSIAIILIIFIITTIIGCGNHSNEVGSSQAGTINIDYYDTSPSTSDSYYNNIYNPSPGAAETAASDDYYDSIYRYEQEIMLPPDRNTEEYKQFTETGFSLVSQNPLSTFAADVDTASYANLRRLINSGYNLRDLPEGSVRIEELLNYFSYNFSGPSRHEPFGVTTEISACPWNPESELLMIGLETKDIIYEDFPPSNLVFLIDVSGSMSPQDRLPLLQQCFVMLAEHLTAKDRVSIVTYAGSDTTVLEGVSGNNQKEIINAINGLSAGGSTNGGDGIISAYRLAEKYFIEGGNNRVILATDGDLNVGITSEQDLTNLIIEKRESGVFLSVLGVGSGNIKDNKMKALALNGNGNYSFIDSEREGRKVLIEEMGGTLLTVCKDVKLQVEFNPAVVKEYRLIGYENRRMDWQDFRNDEKDAGEIGAGHSVTALYEIILHEPLNNGISPVVAGGNLRYAANHDTGRVSVNSRALTDEWLTLSIRFKRPAENVASELYYPVDFESYRTNPSNDFRFAAAVAEFGLIASDSAFQGNASLGNVRSVLRGLRLGDEYKEEFYELVSKVR